MGRFKNNCELSGGGGGSKKDRKKIKQDLGRNGKIHHEHRQLIPLKI